IHQSAVSNRPFCALAKDALQIGNWIGRMGERIGPLLREMRMNDLPHNRVSQIFFALEVMKQCAFGRTRIIYDAIEATALESVFVKFVESGIEDSLSRVFGRPVGGYSHCASINQYRPVGMSSSSNFFSRSAKAFSISKRNSALNCCSAQNELCSSPLQEAPSYMRRSRYSRRA